MEQAQAGEDSKNPPNNPAVAAARPAIPPAVVPSHVSQATCPTCGMASGASSSPTSYVFAIGHIEPRFPRLSVEKEFAQATGRAATEGLSDRQALQAVLSERNNRYLAKQLCWVLTVQGIETYILVPADPTDTDLLVQALRSSPSPADLDVVVGARGGMAGADVCNGLIVPIVLFDQIYSFDRESLLRAIPKPDNADEGKFMSAAGDVFDRIHQQADNAGATDADRALNYLAVRYPAIYASAARAFAANSSLTSVDVRPSPLSGVRNIVDVIFSFTSRTTDVTEKQFVRVDVTEEFPFLVTRLSPYFDR
jgi:hypothetical protein